MLTASAPIQRRFSAVGEVNKGSDYSDEELEFLKAIDQYKRLHRRPHPSWTEVLGVLRGLGWRKQETGVRSQESGENADASCVGHDAASFPPVS